MKTLYRFSSDFYYGRVEGVFIADDTEVAAALGKEASFGSILGKHSEVDIEITAENTKALTSDPNVLAIVEQHGLTSGRNPLDYIRCGTCHEIRAYHTGPMDDACMFAQRDDDEDPES